MGCRGHTKDSDMRLSRTGSRHTPLRVLAGAVIALLGALTCLSVFAVPTRAEAPGIWYLAEGYTGCGFQEYICLGNPGASAAQVTATFLFNGAPSIEREYSIPPCSRYTIDVNCVVGPGREVATRLTSPASDIAVERSLYFDYKGVWPGSHTVQAAMGTSLKWYFAEGYTGPGFDEYVCVLNPGLASASLVFRFQTPSGEQVRTGTVGASSRATFKVNDLLGPGIESSLELESDCPVVAERPMYFDYLGTGAHHWQGGHCVMGATAPATGYYFAEGTTRCGFEEWLTIQNAKPYPIIVNAEYQFAAGQGGTLARSYSVGPKTRFTAFAPAEAGAEKDVSVRLTSEDEFLAERPMYFSFRREPLVFIGGHCALGSPAASSSWFLAEGYTGPYFEEWLCIQNPSSESSTVGIEYFTQEQGALPTRFVQVAGHSRMTVLVNEHAGPNLSVASRLTVKGGPHVVVERPLYFDRAGSPVSTVDPVPVDPAPVDPAPVDPPPAPAAAGLHGMCFSPYLTTLNWTVTVEEISGLMDKIAPYTHWIRTFGSEGEWDAMPDLAREKGMSIAAGCDIWTDLPRNQREVDALVDQVQRGDVTVAVVGDETLENGAATEDQLISYIGQVKAAGAAVSTSMTYTEWPKWPRLIAECDFLVANIYPYWDQVSIEGAIGRLDYDYRQVTAVAGGKKVIVETGWPTAGPVNGAAVPSGENAARYLSEFVSWSQANAVEYYYFVAFDELWKDEGGVGPHWGLWTTAATLKPEYAAVLQPWR